MGTTHSKSGFLKKQTNKNIKLPFTENEFNENYNRLLKLRKDLEEEENKNYITIVELESIIGCERRLIIKTCNFMKINLIERLIQSRLKKCVTIKDAEKLIRKLII